MGRRDELVIGDTWIGEVEVFDHSGRADLTDADVVVHLRQANGNLLIAPEAVIVDGPAGLLRWEVPAETTATFKPESLDYGVRVTVDGVVSTVLRERVRVVLGPVQAEAAP